VLHLERSIRQVGPYVNKGIAYIICPLFAGYHQKYGKVTDPFPRDLSGHARRRYVTDGGKTGTKQQLSQVLAVEAMMKDPSHVPVNVSESQRLDLNYGNRPHCSDLPGFAE